MDLNTRASGTRTAGKTGLEPEPISSPINLVPWRKYAFASLAETYDAAALHLPARLMSYQAVSDSAAAAPAPLPSPFPPPKVKVEQDKPLAEMYCSFQDCNVSGILAFVMLS